MNALRFLLATLIFVPCVFANEPPKPQEAKMPLTAAAEPKELFKYRLWPEPAMRTAGNAAVLYPRAFSPEYQATRAAFPDKERLDELLKMPLAQLKDLKDDEALACTNKVTFRDIEAAARMRYVEWELWDRVKSDGIHLLLPELSGYRRCAKWLCLQARYHLAIGDYATAAHKLETCLGLARDMSEAPTLIHSLVGIAIAHEAVNQLEEWIRTPGSPNLYWALTYVPSPLIDLRTAFGGERLFIDRSFPGIRERIADPNLPPLSAEKCQEIYAGIASIIVPQVLDAATIVVQQLEPTKKDLRERGWTDAQLDSKPPLQIILMGEIAEHDRGLDENMALIGLPYPQRLTRAAKLAERSSRYSIAKHLFPAAKVHAAPLRLERRFAALRTVEAIRAHIAKTGALPTTLADVTILDVPNDPATGQAFVYTKNESGAVLSGPALPVAIDGSAFTFNITLAK